MRLRRVGRTEVLGRQLIRGDVDNVCHSVRRREFRADYRSSYVSVVTSEAGGDERLIDCADMRRSLYGLDLPK